MLLVSSVACKFPATVHPLLRFTAEMLTAGLQRHCEKNGDSCVRTAGPQRHCEKIGDGCVLEAGLQRHCQKIGDSCVLAAGLQRHCQEIGDNCVLTAGLQRHCQKIGDSCVLTAGLERHCQKIGDSCILTAGLYCRPFINSSHAFPCLFSVCFPSFRSTFRAIGSVHGGNHCSHVETEPNIILHNVHSFRGAAMTRRRRLQ